MSLHPFLIAATVLGTGILTLQGATTWTAGFDFADNETPDGPNELLSPNFTVPEWSYGSRSVVASTTLNNFAPANHTNALSGFSQLQGWQTGSLTTVVNVTGAVFGDLGPYEMLVHPGNTGPTTFNVVRWIAPSTGSYDFTAKWRTPDLASNGVESDIVKNGVSIFHTVVPAGPLNQTYTQTLSLNSGDIIDFVVGPGGNVFNDSTVFDATITLVPEPSAALLAVAAVPFLFRRRRA